MERQTISDVQAKELLVTGEGVIVNANQLERLLAELDTLRAQLKASQETALDYHRRWQEAEEKIVAIEEARNAAMKQHRDAVLDAMGKADQGMNALIAIGHKLSIENAEQFHAAEYAQDKIVDKIVEWRQHYFAAVERAGLAEADVKLLREALETIRGHVVVEPDKDGLIEDATCCYCDASTADGCDEDCPRSIADAALTATAPKGEQGCQSKS